MARPKPSFFTVIMARVHLHKVKPLAGSSFALMEMLSKAFDIMLSFHYPPPKQLRERRRRRHEAACLLCRGLLYINLSGNGHCSTHCVICYWSFKLQYLAMMFVISIKISNQHLNLQTNRTFPDSVNV